MVVYSWFGRYIHPRSRLDASTLRYLVWSDHRYLVFFVPRSEVYLVRLALVYTRKYASRAEDGGVRILVEVSEVSNECDRKY